MTLVKINSCKGFIVFLNCIRLFLISLKYGLILLRYYSTDSVLFLSPLLSYSI